MWVSQIFILSPRGDKIVYKDYRQDLPRTCDEVFFRKYKFWDGSHHQAKSGDCPPFFMEKGIMFSFVRKNNLLIVAATRQNHSPGLYGEMLVRVAKVLKDYLGVLSEEAIRKNFILVYELLDEIIDFGVIQELSSERMRPYIFNEPLQTEQQTQDLAGDSLASRLKKGELFERTKKSAASQFSIVTGHQQRKNELYIDIIERLNVVCSATGSVIASEIDGSITLKSFLSGSPDLIVGLNEDLVVGRSSDGRHKYASVCLDSVNFHESADYSRFESDRSLVMKPPDGEFTLMNYRLTSEFNLPFRILPTIDIISAYRLEMSLSIRADIPAQTYGAQTTVKVPLPKSTTNVSVEFGVGATGQTYEYKQTERYVTWNIPKFQGGTEQICKIRISTGTPATAATKKELGPISMNFEVPMHNSSGLAIRFLRLEERSQTYNPQRWVRNITQANSYICR